MCTVWKEGDFAACIDCVKYRGERAVMLTDVWDTRTTRLNIKTLDLLGPVERL